MQDLKSYLQEAIGSAPGKAPTSIEPDQIYHLQLSLYYYLNHPEKDVYIVKGKDIFNFLKLEGKDGCLDRFAAYSVKVGKVTFNEPLGIRKTFVIVDELNNPVGSAEHLIAILQGKTHKYELTATPKKVDKYYSSLDRWVGTPGIAIGFANDHPDQFEVLLKNFNKLPKGIQKALRKAKEYIHDPKAYSKIENEKLLALYDKHVK